MPIAVRPSVATGVALMGAGAIALAPIQPAASSLSNIHAPAVFSTASIQLTAAGGFDPVTPWVDVLTAAASNVAAIGEEWLADPLPALRQLGTNWLGYGETVGTALGGVATGTWTYFTQTVPESINTALQQIADGDLSGAASTINNALGSAIFSIGLPLFPVLDIPGKITDNLSAVVKTLAGLNTALPLVLGILGPIEGGIQAFGDSAQSVLDAAAAGQFVTALNNAVNTLPAVVGAVLNGYQDGAYPGLFSLPPEPGVLGGGLVHALLVDIPQAIAVALGAPAPVTTAAASKQAALSAEAVAADAPAAVESGSGVARSKSATAAVSPAADSATDSSASADSAADGAAAASGSDSTVKDGNKFEPGQVTGSGAPGARGAAAAGSSKPAGAAGAKDSGSSNAAKGHSARHAAGN
ncbi:hypothetical protein [Mycolicibacterium aichiense]|uniref:PE-PGRS family protein n=1 Tax=Mycolicibacterium aichiense TaxID=1799 RepID=A0AAD1MEK4_9MYCO|nr:hypothetical protein [Mycolicibacterium aichiense]MCV7016199.1 hypothetical protein [Mycolicibacterium aichiense]BBX10036.1 hypothetical protein MAIC_48390 [Mycolicibacterium aichiense]STZ26299.1 PE-PGRS family protein [Mycolicibacterium aichiense]